MGEPYQASFLCVLLLVKDCRRLKQRAIERKLERASTKRRRERERASNTVRNNERKTFKLINNGKKELIYSQRKHTVTQPGAFTEAVGVILDTILVHYMGGWWWWNWGGNAYRVLLSSFAPLHSLISGFGFRFRTSSSELLQLSCVSMMLSC